MAAAQSSGSARSLQVDLPHQEHKIIRQSWPAIGCWFWMEEEFQPDGYKRFLDLHRDHSCFGLLTTSIRHPVEVTDPAVHDQIKRAAEYAGARGMRLAMDLDVRLARKAFQEAHPDELQEIVCLRETPLSEEAEATLKIDAISLGDHYTHRAAPYFTVSSRLLRAYSYRRGPDGIDPKTVENITGRCRIEETEDHGLTITIPPFAGQTGRTACLMAAFTLFTPAAFAPHLIAFERAILQQYADVPLAGACKDEWGFPGRFTIRTDELWFSRFMAEAYAQRRPGHELTRDLLLMSFGERGRECERSAAINHYMEMNHQRNAEIESAFYESIKAVFSPHAVAATHPTWFPFPNEKEIFKNGLDWWGCRRDLAQTDEATPFPARTALAKKWQSPLWYNMYYEASRAPYEEDLWRSALAGGRLNFHPEYPNPEADMRTSLLTGDLMRAASRIQLLNYISSMPVDCPAAVIFGHPAALNWAHDSFADVGLGITNALWETGHYADLIPSSEIEAGALMLAEDGRIQYGPQRYAAVVLYHPQFERPAVAEFFRHAAGLGSTTLFQIGPWNLDFEGNTYDGETALPAAMKAMDTAACIREVIHHLEEAGIAPQTPSTMRATGSFPESMMPLPSGRCRLLDGTHILASCSTNVMGDPITETLTVKECPVVFDAVGVAAVRLDAHGHVEAMAAGGLRLFEGPDLTIELSERIDLALWHNIKGEWVGALHGFEGAIPEALVRITQDWTRVQLPVPFAP